MKTIPVSEVELAERPLPVIDREKALKSLLHAPVEQLSPGRELVLCRDVHPLADAAYRAFYDHRPLVLSPDAVWFCLVQGLAHHISLNAESLRERFVRHQGKEKLLVTRGDFVLGQQNPWPEVFAAFSDQIAVRLGKLRDLVVADFSTTGPTERASFEVALMDAFQPYFEYEMSIGCGIPSITLTGTPDDWRSVRRRASMLSELGLEWWTPSLLPVLDQIVRSVEGEPERAFWQSFFRHESSSGGNELTGWIQLLFPYLIQIVRDEEPDDAYAEIRTLSNEEEKRFRAEASRKATRRPVRNSYLADWQAGLKAAEERDWLTWNNSQGPSIYQLPSGTASAPVLLTDLRDGSKHPLRFVAGLVGVSQDTAGALAPEFGWAIVHEPKE
ncbi:DUF4419 domain-containing protein [Hyalangium versicolor]|uniref:DUF4419 domain-containing protein n=1 Tax=Hyalangium versicolor TaxID=2861190 RepID=UPI001CD01761|nr:DUF4419 domain-containing protein [Hyalangium versicolor]